MCGREVRGVRVCAYGAEVRVYLEVYSVYVCVCPSTHGRHICLSVGPHSHLQSAVQCGGVPSPASEGL